MYERQAVYGHQYLSLLFDIDDPWPVFLYIVFSLAIVCLVFYLVLYLLFHSLTFCLTFCLTFLFKLLLAGGGNTPYP